MSTGRTRLKVAIRGAVQGVGFRPFVYRLATESNIAGWVTNSTEGVFIEAEGSKRILDKFLLRLQREKPPRAFIQSLEFSYLDPLGFSTFQILESQSNGAKSAFILPDIATCPDCLAELFDPSNRRYRYPFTNCTNCGPRFSIIESLPYDRPNTSMKKFAMCPACEKEYLDPLDRRFHAQPNACPVCGPRLHFWDEGGKSHQVADEALTEAARAVIAGKILALKGIGGFQLIVDARNEKAVKRLRERKHREEKPFALMYPELKSVVRDCEVSNLEERTLLSPESPIVLLKKKLSEVPGIAESVAPANPYLGIMLPYTPLHHLFMSELGFPIVATSGNLSDEPICTDEYEALQRLGGIADCFLVHNRPIVRHVDDSIVRIILGREMVLRRARGFAPLPITIEPSEGQDVAERTFGRSMLAVGAHLKNTVALSVGKNVFVSQHIGDLETQESLTAFHRVIDDFERLYDVKPEEVVCDLHPDYLSTQFARERTKQPLMVQHHYAHVAACMAENQLEGEILGVSWDGTGFGSDGTIWGGEFLLANNTSFERVATWRQFPLPGGDRAIKEPRRSAVGLLYKLFGSEAFKKNEIPSVSSFNEKEMRFIVQMLENGINSPLTSSVGRLFDAVASIVGLRHTMAFEGQAAMELEFLTSCVQTDKSYDLALKTSRSGTILDWSPIIEAILLDAKKVIPVGEISAKFHNTLAESILLIAKRLNQKRVVLTGGCFQNKYLTEKTVELLKGNGIRPYWHQRIPPNDGGISLGQIYAAVCQKKAKPKFQMEETI